MTCGAPDFAGTVTMSRLNNLVLGKGAMNFAAATPSAPPINVSQPRAASTDTVVSPLMAKVTIRVNAYAPHAMSYRSGKAMA